MKGLPVIFFKTIIISIISSIVANCIYYALITHSGSGDYTHAVPLIIERTFSLGIIVAVMSLPMLFLFNPNYWNSLTGRLSLYFAGPILFIIAIFSVRDNSVTKTSNLLTGAVFFIVSLVFYYRITRKNKTATP